MATLIIMVRDLAQRRYRESHWPVTGSATGGDTTSLIDTTALAYSSGDANAWDRKWVYRETSPSDTVISSRVTESGFNAGAGDLTLSPALSSSFASGNNYIITDEHIDVLKNAINRVQRNIFLPTFFPLSLHVVANDANDMEPSTIATDYSSTGATLATESTIVKNGAQSLKSTASVAGGFANLDAVVGVQESQSLYAAVDCYVTSGDDATFGILNKFNAQIIDAATSDEPSWMELVIQFTVPASCEQIDLLMGGDANGDITYWDNIQLWSSGRRVYSLPSWITRPEQLLDVRSFAQGTGGPSSDNDYRSNETRSQPLSYGFENVDRRGNLPLHIWVDAGSARPFIYALRPLVELSADTSNSVAEQDFVVRWAERLVREPDKASETMALLRAIHFQRVTTELPTRVGVSMR